MSKAYYRKEGDFMFFNIKRKWKQRFNKKYRRWWTRRCYIMGMPKDDIMKRFYLTEKEYEEFLEGDWL